MKFRISFLLVLAFLALSCDRENEPQINIDQEQEYVRVNELTDISEPLSLVLESLENEGKNLDHVWVYVGKQDPLEKVNQLIGDDLLNAFLNNEVQFDNNSNARTRCRNGHLEESYRDGTGNLQWRISAWDCPASGGGNAVSFWGIFYGGGGSSTPDSGSFSVDDGSSSRGDDISIYEFGDQAKANAYVLKSMLSLTNDQQDWLVDNPKVAEDLLAYIQFNLTSAESKQFAKDLINAMMEGDDEAVRLLEANIWEEEKIDDSQLKPCMQTIMNDLKNLTQGVGQIVAKFAGNTPGYNWEVKDGILGTGINANTSAYNKTLNKISTTFDSNKFKNASEISVARTILHESVHAYLNAFFRLDYATASIKYPDILKDLAVSKYGSQNETQHAEFVRNFIADISLALKEYGQNQGYSLGNQFYNDLAWGGLTQWTKKDSQGNPIKDSQGNYVYEETPWFKANFPNTTNRNRIVNTINSEAGVSNLNNQKGQNAGC